MVIDKVDDGDGKGMSVFFDIHGRDNDSDDRSGPESYTRLPSTAMSFGTA